MLQLASAYIEPFCPHEIIDMHREPFNDPRSSKVLPTTSANTAGNTFSPGDHVEYHQFWRDYLENSNLRPGSLGTGSGLLFSHRIFQSTMHLAFERVETLFAATGHRGNLPLDCNQIHETTNKTCKLRRASSDHQGRAAPQRFTFHS